MSELPHLNRQGEVHMVSVTDKPVTARRAIAFGRLLARPEVLKMVQEGRAPKGDVLAVARVAAIMAVKKTADWIPLAHPIAVEGTAVEIHLTEESFEVQVTAETSGRTGVEMEALTGVVAALLTLYDMLKAQDRAMTIADVHLLSKSGGRSGTFGKEA